MDLYFNKTKLTKFDIAPESTVGQVKKRISDWLVPQGYTNYSILIQFYNGTKLDLPKNNSLDKANLTEFKEALDRNAGEIHITAINQPVHQDQNQLKGKTVYVLSHQPYGDQEITTRVFSDMAGLIDYYYRTEMEEEGYTDKNDIEEILIQIDVNNWYQMSTNTIL